MYALFLLAPFSLLSIVTARHLFASLLSVTVHVNLTKILNHLGDWPVPVPVGDCLIKLTNM